MFGFGPKKRRRRALADASACPVPRIETQRYTDGKNPEPFAVDFELMVGDRRIGGVMTEVRGRFMVVQSAGVDEEYQRCGFGTKLYAAAAKFACSTNRMLESDNVRSVDSHGFWKKQERKGRARCTGPSTEGVREGPGPRYGRDNCESYRLAPCTVDLSGTKPKRRRRR